MSDEKAVISTWAPQEFRCRVCLETSTKMYPLEGPIINCDVDISTMLCFCTSLEISMGKGLPSFVCIPCFKTVRIAYNFIHQFKESNKKLMDEKLIRKVEISDPLEVTNNCGGSPKTYKIIDRIETSEVKNVNELETNMFPKSEVEIYGTSHISQVDDFQLVYEELEENLDEPNGAEIYNCEIEPELDETPNINEQNKDESVNHAKSIPRVKVKTRFACPVCPGIYFSSPEEYFINHMLKHEDTSFHCRNCENGMIYNGTTYIKHFRDVHKNQCPYCNKSCPTKPALYAHLRKHSNIKYYCSHRGCSKVFNSNFNLKKHESIHSQDVKHVCEECGLEFKTYDTYRYHQKKHGGRKFLCTYCGRTFIQSVHLKYHMWLHTGIKQFKCDKCDKSYTSVTQMKKHKRRHHPSDSEEGNEIFLEVNI
ncbi:unnamed protein product [Phaedon cochleariae]|uniref:Zinc finger protein n=1 Tax=Phaedon cochleariae TaxID=80249 RepID=A0A9N9SKS8_PHACE|nr:unnamed protein product [Phaedon cochleariae]